MTDEEVAELTRMWAEGVPVKQIARKLNYQSSYINGFARVHRDILPSRHPIVPEDVQAVWVERIRSGECSKSAAARALGVARNTIIRYCKLYEME